MYLHQVFHQPTVAVVGMEGLVPQLPHVKHELLGPVVVPHGSTGARENRFVAKRAPVRGIVRKARINFVKDLEDSLALALLLFPLPLG